MKKAYSAEKLSFSRRALIASVSESAQKKSIHAFAGIDISKPRERMHRHYLETGEKLSLTAYIVRCLALTMREFPRFNSFIKGRRLIILEDLTVSVMVERSLPGESMPEPVAVHDAWGRDHKKIQDDIMTAKRLDDKTFGSLTGSSWIKWIPSFLFRLFVKIADKNINMARRFGKVAVTAVGMYSKQPVWFIPHGSATVLVTVGSIENKVVFVDGQFESREHLCLTVSFDHHIIDGAPAAQFMNRFSEIVKSAVVLDE